MQKGLAPILIVLLITVVVGGYFVYKFSSLRGGAANLPRGKAGVAISPTSAPAYNPSPTSSTNPVPNGTGEITNWKTYTNTKYKYTLKYPSDIFVRFICPASELNNGYLEPRTTETEDSINMPTCGRDNRYTIEIVVYDSFNEPEANENYKVTKENILIGGVKARKYITTLIKEPLGPTISFSEDVFTDYKGKLYLLHLGKKEQMSNFDKILSTFKFTQ